MKQNSPDTTVNMLIELTDTVLTFIDYLKCSKCLPSNTDPLPQAFQHPYTFCLYQDDEEIYGRPCRCEISRVTCTDVTWGERGKCLPPPPIFLYLRILFLTTDLKGGK
jgi:hypothetical protein